MKRILATMLSIALMMSLTACSGKKDAQQELPVETAEVNGEETGNEEQEDNPFAELEPVVIRASCTSLPDSPITIHWHETLDEIEELTQGKITFERTDSASTIFNGEPEIFDLCRSGSFDISGFALTQFSTFMPELEITCWPYVFTGKDMIRDYFSSKEWEKRNDILEETSGMRALTVYYSGLRNLTTEGVEVRRPEDLKGIKIRSMDSAIYVTGLNAMGATAVPVAWAELYFALQTGVVTGQENSMNVIKEGKLQEVQDTICKTAHLYSLTAYAVNVDFWNGLEKPYQDILTEIFTLRMNEYAEQVDAIDEEIEEEFKEAGCKIIDDVDIPAFAERCSSVFRDTYKDDQAALTFFDEIQQYSNIE